MPGPNDYHIVIEKQEDGTQIVRSEPGLGADEPKEIPKRSDAVRAAFEKESAALVERERELIAREEALAERERALEANASNASKRGTSKKNATNSTGTASTDEE